MFPYLLVFFLAFPDKNVQALNRSGFEDDVAIWASRGMYSRYVFAFDIGVIAAQHPDAQTLSTMVVPTKDLLCQVSQTARPSAHRK